jgi:hypothetical protein
MKDDKKKRRLKRNLKKNKGKGASEMMDLVRIPLLDTDKEKFMHEINRVRRLVNNYKMNLDGCDIIIANATVALIGPTSYSENLSKLQDKLTYQVFKHSMLYLSEFLNHYSDETIAINDKDGILVKLRYDVEMSLRIFTLFEDISMKVFPKEKLMLLCMDHKLYDFCKDFLHQHPEDKERMKSFKRKIY